MQRPPRVPVITTHLYLRRRAQVSTATCPGNRGGCQQAAVNPGRGPVPGQLTGSNRHHRVRRPGRRQRRAHRRVGPRARERLPARHLRHHPDRRRRSSGSKRVPRRARATSTAASAPPARWNTSTVSARWNGVGQVEQPHRTRDVLTPDTGGNSLGIPAREDLPERVAHLGGEAEPSGQLSCGQAVRHQAPFHRPASSQDQIGGQAKPVQERCPGPGMASLNQVTARNHLRLPVQRTRRSGHVASPGTAAVNKSVTGCQSSRGARSGRTTAISVAAKSSPVHRTGCPVRSASA